MQRHEAEAVREQLLELLDERHEVGSTEYVVQRATVEPADGDDWAVEIVIRTSLLGPSTSRRFSDLSAGTGGAALTPEELAWHVYRLLEDGTLTQ